jgi:hypothetical protein
MHCSSQLLCTNYAGLILVGRNSSYWVKCDADAAAPLQYLDLDLNPETPRHSVRYVFKKFIKIKFLSP